jgi:hypothetical protein
MAQYEMTPEKPVGRYRTLQIDWVSRSKSAKIASGKRFLNGIEAE